MEERIRKELGLDPPKPPPHVLVRAAGGLLMALVLASPPVLFLLVGVSVTLMNLHGGHPLWLSLLYGLGSVILAGILLLSDGTYFDGAVRCAFILVLILVLFPVFERAREKAHRIEAYKAAHQRGIPPPRPPSGR